MSTKQTPEQKAASKVARDAERAKRYPQAAAKAANPMAQMASALAPSKSAKPAPVKKAGGKTTVKPAGEKAKKQAPKDIVKFIARTMKTGAQVNVLSADARPTSGAKLYAHTHAALAILGMFGEGRPAVPKNQVMTFLGQRAVDYHLKNANFESAADFKIRLSISGANEFKNRVSGGRVNGAIANDYVGLFLDGKMAPALEVKAGNVFQTKFST